VCFIKCAQRQPGVCAVLCKACVVRAAHCCDCDDCPDSRLLGPVRWSGVVGEQPLQPFLCPVFLSRAGAASTMTYRAPLLPVKSREVIVELKDHEKYLKIDEYWRVLNIQLPKSALSFADGSVLLQAGQIGNTKDKTLAEVRLTLPLSGFGHMICNPSKRRTKRHHIQFEGKHRNRKAAEVMQYIKRLAHATVTFVLREIQFGKNDAVSNGHCIFDIFVPCNGSKSKYALELQLPAKALVVSLVYFDTRSKSV
jgi:hypothetical protein